MDYDYMAESLASLTGLPVRLYHAGSFVTLYHHTRFKPDLAILEEPNIFQNSGNISYYMTDTFLFYGLFRAKADSICFVIGPVSHMPPDRSLVNQILRSIGEPASRTTELLNYLTALPAYPLRNFLQILSTINYFINDEKVEVSQLLLADTPPVPPALPEQRAAQGGEAHNTFELENLMLSYVEHGRTDEIATLFRKPSEGRAGTMAADTLRQEKNTLICTATLVTRAAIRGGLDYETAFSLSDIYIQKAELMKDYLGLTRLSAQMIMDFTGRVAELQCGGHNSRLVRTARAYILSHIGEPITTETLSRALGMNRTYLSKRFVEETGLTPGRYITALRLDEARRLLAVSQKPLFEIADYLGFSSQSHFQNVFKKACGVTPLEYRNKASYTINRVGGR